MIKKQYKPSYYNFFKEYDNGRLVIYNTKTYFTTNLISPLKKYGQLHPALPKASESKETLRRAIPCSLLYYLEIFSSRLSQAATRRSAHG